MGRHSNLPTLYDEVKTIEISFLKNHGYLDKGQSGTLRWSIDGRETGSVSVISVINHLEKRIILDYKFNGETRTKEYYFTYKTSNLGKGLVWYFVCPFTGKCCRKLYMASGYFGHREAFRGCMYESQTWSRNNRRKIKFLEPYFKMDEYYSELNSKFFKTHYNGRPTKRYLYLMSQLERAKQIDPYEAEMMMLL